MPYTNAVAFFGHGGDMSMREGGRGILPYGFCLVTAALCGQVTYDGQINALYRLFNSPDPQHTIWIHNPKDHKRELEQFLGFEIHVREGGKGEASEVPNLVLEPFTHFTQDPRELIKSGFYNDRITRQHRPIVASGSTNQITHAELLESYADSIYPTRAQIDAFLRVESRLYAPVYNGFNQAAVQSALEQKFILRTTPAVLINVLPAMGVLYHFSCRVDAGVIPGAVAAGAPAPAFFPPAFGAEMAVRSRSGGIEAAAGQMPHNAGPGDHFAWPQRLEEVDAVTHAGDFQRGALIAAEAAAAAEAGHGVVAADQSASAHILERISAGASPADIATEYASRAIEHLRSTWRLGPAVVVRGAASGSGAGGPGGAAAAAAASENMNVEFEEAIRRSLVNVGRGAGGPGAGGPGAGGPGAVGPITHEQRQAFSHWTSEQRMAKLESLGIRVSFSNINATTSINKLIRAGVDPNEIARPHGRRRGGRRTRHAKKRKVRVTRKN